MTDDPGIVLSAVFLVLALICASAHLAFLAFVFGGISGYLLYESGGFK